MMTGLGQGLAYVGALAGTGIAGTAFLVEGLALKGAKHLSGHKTDRAKIGKIALAAIAVAAAIIATTGIGFAAAFAVSMWFPTSISIPSIAAVTAAALTVFVHMKAFSQSLSQVSQ